ncbi:type II toxin-antitoxin system RelE family toxin [Athalassotoga sp.]|uniref:type II toxin-antitoxin system RelE family toxin n=1 Tax=Athalassotoga sp. TaxID=2022597 RepID=UPI003CFE207A
MIYWHKKAMKHFEMIPRDYQLKIDVAVEKLPDGDVKPLHGKYADFFRLRVGDYRVIFEKKENDIFVLEVLPRGKVY